MTEQIFPDVAPWPEQAAAPAPAGHNKPPVGETVKADFLEELLRERPDFLEKVDQIVAAVGRAQIVDDATLAKGGTLEKTIREATKHVDAVHAKVKEPYLAAGRAVDAEKKSLVARLDDAKSALKRSMNDYMASREAARRAEQAKREAEERARAAAAEEAWPEDAVPLAGARKDEDKIVRSDEGAAVSGTTVWKSEVLDYAAAFAMVESDPKVREAIDAAAARLVRAGMRKLPGVRIWSTVEARSR